MEQKNTQVKNKKSFFKSKSTQDLSMNKISSTAEHHTKISAEAGNFYMTIVTIYLMFTVNGWDPITYVSQLVTKWIPNNFGQILVQVCAMFFSAKVVYDLIYQYVENNHVEKWQEVNKDIWIKGTWLHIHDKPNVRVGDVLIKQDFYTISVDGHNLALPKVDNVSQITIDSLDESDWNYSMAKIVDDEGENTLHGYYTSLHGSKKKTGMHTLTFTSVKDFPIFMTGTFGDVVEEDGQEVKNALGQLRLHKLVPECPYYGKVMDNKTGRVDYYSLVILINEFYEARQKAKKGLDPEFKEYDTYIKDPFMRDITDVIEKRGWKSLV